MQLAFFIIFASVIPVFYMLEYKPLEGKVTHIN